MLELYAHPFSSYCWKVLIALDERDIPFEYRMLDQDHPENSARLRELWPLGKFPVLVEDGRPMIESSIIIEALDDDRFGERNKLIPGERDVALQVRFLDRIFDNHVMTPMNAIVSEYLVDATAPDQSRIAKAGQALDAIYDWLEHELPPEGWAVGSGFTMADCAAAPSLFYADWVREIGTARPKLSAYRSRLLARESVRKVIDDARPYRGYFPPGAPERD